VSSSCRQDRLDCDFAVGDWVDWQRFTTRETTQSRHWHGQIVDQWNARMPEHWLIVRWDESDVDGPYTEPRPDFNPDYIPVSPHYMQERCLELKHCPQGNGLHPRVNRLRLR
jgi:hypothetical protein